MMLLHLTEAGSVTGDLFIAIDKIVSLSPVPRPAHNEYGTEIVVSGQEDPFYVTEDCEEIISLIGAMTDEAVHIGDIAW